MLDLGSLLGGGGEGNGLGGSMIANLVVGQLSNPNTIKMLNEKGIEMFEFLAKNKNISRKDVNVLTKIEEVPDENGNMKEKLYLYVLDKNKAIEKIAVDKFITMMVSQMQAAQAQGG